MTSDKQRIKPLKTSEVAKKTGRPLKEVNEELVKSMASILCTMKEISSVVGVSVDTLEKRFTDVLRIGQEEGKCSLRRLQWKSAEAGNVNMQIWLGKQWLGQRDKQPDEVASTTINVQVSEIPK